jgi:hypothetical protein
MIKVDLSIPHHRGKMSLIILTLICLGVFLAISAMGSGVLLLQRKSLWNLADEIASLDKQYHNLAQEKQGINRYKEIQEDYNALHLSADQSVKQTTNYLEIASLLRKELLPGMRLFSFYLTPDSAVAVCGTPSNLKIQKYIEELYQTGRFTTFKSEPQGSVQGLIEHKITLGLK